jgi:hypothetical protein
VVNVNSAITSYAAQIGRSFAFTPLADYTQLGVQIAGKHVLLVYEQELGSPAQMGIVGTAWQNILDTFVRNGGVVVVTDFTGDSWRILQNAGLMNITTSQSETAGSIQTVADPGNVMTFTANATYTGPVNTRSYTTTNAVRLIESITGRSTIAQSGLFNSCVIVEDFESGLWPTGTWTAPEFHGGTASATAAHDYGFGVIDPTFYYEVDVLLGRPGQRIGAWMRFTSPSGRGHIGFGATSQSTYSFVIAANTNRIIMQRNEFYGFQDVASTPFTVALNTWYFAEVEFINGALVTGRVFDEDGTLLGVLTHDFTTMPPGGVALRGVSGTHIDTLTACAP